MDLQLIGLLSQEALGWGGVHWQKRTPQANRMYATYPRSHRNDGKMPLDSCTVNSAAKSLCFSKDDFGLVYWAVVLNDVVCFICV